MKTKKILSIGTILIVLSFLNNAFCQGVSKVGTSSAPFLKIPVSARATSLGGAFVSMADDASSLFWNPGGLARVGQYSLIVDHSPWIVKELQHNFIGFVIPMEEFGNVGFSITSLSTDQMEVTTVSSPEGTGESFDAQFLAIGFTYSRYLTESFSIGASAKYVSERIYHSEALGLAFDIGAVYNTPLDGLKLGFNISNFGSKMRINGEDLNIQVDIDGTQLGNNESIVAQLKTEEFDLPLMMQVGLSYEALAFDDNKLVVAVDGLNPSDNEQSVNMGAEFSMFNNLFVLRGGYSEMFLSDNERGLTLGAGFNTNIESYFNVNISYAFQEFKHLSDVNRFTLLLLF